MNLQEGIAQAERQRKLADLLRKQGMQPGPEGQMVSGHYVAPSIFQQLMPLANAGAGAYTDYKATEAEKESTANIEQAKQNWMAQQPQAVAARTAPNMEEGGEYTIDPGQPLTEDRILKHTTAGLNIPGNEKAATLYNAGALAGLTREDTQAARKETLKATLDAQRVAAQEKNDLARETMIEKLKQDQRELERKAEHDKEWAKANERDNATRLEVARMNAANVAAANQVRLQIAHLEKSKLSDKEQGKINTDTEHLSKRAQPLSAVIQPAGSIQALIDKATTVDPKTGKKVVGDIPGFGFVARNTPLGMLGPEEAANAQAQQAFGNAMLRAQAGLSQTLSESEKALIEQMRKGTAKQDQFVAVWPGLREKLNSEVATVRSGYSQQVQDEFDARMLKGGSPIAFKSVKSKWDTDKPAAAPTSATVPAGQAPAKPAATTPGKPGTRKLVYNPATGQLE